MKYVIKNQWMSSCPHLLFACQRNTSWMLLSRVCWFTKTFKPQLKLWHVGLLLLLFLTYLLILFVLLFSLSPLSLSAAGHKIVADGSVAQGSGVMVVQVFLWFNWDALTRWSQSGLTMPLSRYSVGTSLETNSCTTCLGTFGHSHLSLLSHSGLILA